MRLPYERVDRTITFSGICSVDSLVKAKLSTQDNYEEVRYFFCAEHNIAWFVGLFSLNESTT